LIAKEPHPDLHFGGFIDNLEYLDLDLFVRRGAGDEDRFKRILVLADLGKLQILDGRVGGSNDAFII
jgi:hypothetical protein